MGIGSEHPAILIFVPWVLTLVLVYQLQVHADVMSLAAARARIGELLEAELGDEPLVTERLGRVRHGGQVNPSITMVHLLYLVIYIVAAVAGGVAAEREGIGYLIAYIPITLFAFATLICAVVEKHAAWERSHAALHRNTEPAPSDLRRVAKRLLRRQ